MKDVIDATANMQFSASATAADHKRFDELTEQLRQNASSAQQLAARFDRYLTPRLPYLDQAPLVAAIKQAATDADLYYNHDPAINRSNQLSEKCGTECKGVAGTHAGYSACYMSCIKRDELGARVVRCEETQFLPY